jgi:hypothetical protein
MQVANFTSGVFVIGITPFHLPARIEYNVLLDVRKTWQYFYRSRAKRHWWPS